MYRTYCWKKQCEIESFGRTKKGADASPSYKTWFDKTICESTGQGCCGFSVSSVNFPKLLEAKVKAGVFIGPQIKKILKSDEFIEMLNKTEKEAWKSFAAVVNGFLGNHMEYNYADLIANLVKSYGDAGCQ